MSGESIRIALATSAAVAVLIVVSAGPAAATSITYSGIQTVSSLVMAGTNESQGQGHIMLAGATVRDHRSNQGGTYNPSGWYGGGGRGAGGRRGQTPPVSPGNGEGGVTVTPTPGSQRGITCLGDLC